MTNDDYVRIGAKFNKSVATSLQQLCKDRGESISAALRRSVRRELKRQGVLDKDKFDLLRGGEEL